MSKRRETMQRSTRTGTHERERRLRLLRPAEREVWHEEKKAGGSHVVVRTAGGVEQHGVERESATRGVRRHGVAVWLHVRVAADALASAYADRCRVAEAGTRE